MGAISSRVWLAWLSPWAHFTFGCSDNTDQYLMGHVTLTAIIGTSILVVYLWVKLLQLIWRSGTRRFHLRVPDHQMSCRDLATWQGTRTVYPTMAAGRHALLRITNGASWVVLSCYLIESPENLPKSQIPQNTSHNAPFWEMCSFCPEKCIVGYGICTLWDLWDWSIVRNCIHIHQSLWVYNVISNDLRHLEIPQKCTLYILRGFETSEVAVSLVVKCETPTSPLRPVAATLMRPIPPEAGHYRDKSAHPMDARMHPKGVRGPCCVR